jgi:SAM-dependent methyltransferase
MPDVAWNARVWGHDYHWPDSGEVWSSAWGGSEAQWFGSLYPRLRRLLPVARILELAPGYGRWTKFLLPAYDRYVGVDLAEACVVECRKRFASTSHAHSITNDGRSLYDVPDRSFDLIFPFDSLVHTEVDVLEGYIAQALQKLAPGGIAFIHHSNLMDQGNKPPALHEHARARSVSAALVASLIAAGGGLVLVQKVINWVDTGMIDAVTTFAQAQDFPGCTSTYLTNPHFMEEAAAIREYHSKYLSILPENSKQARL